MKPSKYNSLIMEDDSVVFYNNLTESSFRTSKENASAINAILTNPNSQDSKFDGFITDMKSQGFIVDDDYDEFGRVRNKYDGLSKSDSYTFMVLPTYQCNLRCWYCIQKHADSWLNDETIKRIKTRVRRETKSDSIKHISLMWFGGEPLLAYDKVVELTKWTKNLAESGGKSFACSITTNGTLLNEQRIEELKEAGVDHYQITIDGDRATHNKVKVLGNMSAYDTTLQNIGLLSRHTTCSLRYNYTKDNLNPEGIINDLDEILPKDRKNIIFRIYRVWQEDEDSVPESMVENLMKRAFSINLLPMVGGFGLCYTDYKHFDCFFANGTIGKCDNIDPSELTSFVDKDGNVKYGDEESSFIPVMEYKDSECHDCKYLPTCWGPCAAKRYPMLKQGNRLVCFYGDKDRQMADMIRKIQRNREYMKKAIENNII